MAVYLAESQPWVPHSPRPKPLLGAGRRAGRLGGRGRPSQTWVPAQAGSACSLGLSRRCQRGNYSGYNVFARSSTQDRGRTCSGLRVPASGASETRAYDWGRGAVGGGGRRDRATRPRCPAHVAATSEPE